MASQPGNHPDRNADDAERMVVVALANVVSAAAVRYTAGESEILAATAIVLSVAVLGMLLLRLRIR